MSSLEICTLTGSGNHRGELFQFPDTAFRFLARIAELHYATIEPGGVRGNHYHQEGRECILLAYHGPWRLACRLLKATSTITRAYKGKGAVIIKIDTGVVHAIKNTGDKPLHLVSCSNARPDSAGTKREVLLE